MISSTKAKVPSASKSARWMLTCACFVGGFEGLACTAYPDRLAHNIPTVCYGETEGVHLGDHYTAAECEDMLANKLPRYWNEIASCIHVPVTDNEKVAFTSFGYNVGTGAFCHGSVARKLNAGDTKGACDALLAYDHAAGKKVAGLTRRRQAERKLCMTPDKAPAPPKAAPAPPKAAIVHPWWDVMYWLFGK